MISKKIKVLQISHDLAIGGLQRVVSTICRYIDASKFEMSVLCLRNLGEFQKDIESFGVPVSLLPERANTVDHFLFKKVAKFIKDNDFDVIHTHNTQPFLDGGLGNLLAGKRKWIHTDHARNYPDKKRYILYEWMLSHFVDHIVGVSEHTSECLRKFGHISSKKIVTIHNGIVPDDFQLKIDKSGMRANLGLPGKGLIIGTAVRLSPQKNIEMLLDAFVQISAVVPSVALVIAGNGPLELSLKEKARSLKLNNVFFLGPRTDIANLLQIFDLYVLPSIWEGLPMGVLEAMAAKCTIVATNVGGVKSAITHGCTGVLVPSNDTNALTKEIITLLLNPELSELYRNNAYNDFMMRFTGINMTQSYEKLYS